MDTDDHPDADTTFEWIEPPAAAPRTPRTRWWRTGMAAACVLATLVALLVTQTRAGQTASAPSAMRGAIALQTNVPWAQAVIDDYTQPATVSGDLGMPRELATRATPHGAPGLTISTAPGRHVVSLGAEGFTSRRAAVTVSGNRAVRLQLPLAPTAAGRAAMLAAVDDLLGSMRATVDVGGNAPWLSSLGLGATTKPLAVDIRFHATALASRDPSFVAPGAARGPAPAAGTLGVTVLVSVQVTATEPGTGQIVAQRTFLLGTNDAVWASVWYDAGRWTASDPCLHDSNEPVTPQTLLAVLQRTGPSATSATRT